MKKILLSVVLLITGSSFGSHIGTGEFVPVLSCHNFPLVPDSGTSVTISEGGFSGITQAMVSRFVLGRFDTHRYFVRHQTEVDAVLYVGTGARGQNFQLSIHPDGIQKDGSMLGELISDTGETLKLSCKYTGGQVNLDD